MYSVTVTIVMAIAFAHSSHAAMAAQQPAMPPLPPPPPGMLPMQPPNIPIPINGNLMGDMLKLDGTQLPADLPPTNILNDQLKPAGESEMVDDPDLKTDASGYYGYRPNYYYGGAYPPYYNSYNNYYNRYPAYGSYYPQYYSNPYYSNPYYSRYPQYNPYRRTYNPYY